LSLPVSAPSPFRFAIAGLLALGCSIVAGDFIKRHAFTGVDGVQLVYETENDTLLRLYYGYGMQQDPQFTLENSQVVQALTGSVRELSLIEKNKSLVHARLEIGTPTELKIHNMVVFNNISNTSITLLPRDLLNILHASEPTTTISIEDTLLTVKTDSYNSYLRINYLFSGSNQLLLYGIPLFIGLLTFLYALRFNPRSIPAIRDLLSRDRGIRIYRRELDGLRGIAALLVLLEHTWWRFSGSGATGVWIFFALSGYLLSQPFIAIPQRALNPGFVVQYIFRRLARILPMYFVTLVLIFGVTDYSQLLLSHVLFLQAEGHLWTIPQEVFFYLTLPLLMILIYMLAKLPHHLFLVLFAGLTALLLWNPNIIGIQLYGYSTYRAPFLGWFLVGMFVAYANPGGAYWQNKLSDKSRKALSWLGLTVTVLLLAASSSWLSEIITGSLLLLPVEYKAMFSVAGAILMYLILSCPGTLLSRVFSFTPLRAIGIVGYSYYLLHPLVIDAVMDISMRYYNYPLLHGRLFIVSSIVTWLVCLFTYSLIERPFLLKKHQS
jgi:peptidoglycan/LPS O-acetylase OafA/YrhL